MGVDLAIRLLPTSQVEVLSLRRISAFLSCGITPVAPKSSTAAVAAKSSRGEMDSRSCLRKVAVIEDQVPPLHCRSHAPPNP